MENEIQTKLNFKVDTPTANNRVYTKDVLTKAFDEFLKDNKEVKLYHDSNYTGGLLKEYAINSDKYINLKVETLNTPDGKLLKDLLDKYQLTICGVGCVDENNVIKDNFKIVNLFVDLKSGEIA